MWNWPNKKKIKVITKIGKYVVIFGSMNLNVTTSTTKHTAQTKSIEGNGQKWLNIEQWILVMNEVGECEWKIQWNAIAIWNIVRWHMLHTRRHRNKHRDSSTLVLPKRKRSSSKLTCSKIAAVAFSGVMGSGIFLMHRILYLRCLYDGYFEFQTIGLVGMMRKNNYVNVVNWGN